jgi:hypothetical protein
VFRAASQSRVREAADVDADVHDHVLRVEGVRQFVFVVARDVLENLLVEGTRAEGERVVCDPPRAVCFRGRRRLWRLRLRRRHSHKRLYAADQSAEAREFHLEGEREANVLCDIERGSVFEGRHRSPFFYVIRSPGAAFRG